nr:hypothetical protein Iba_chr09bCG3690 [Ipomoea batatas]
MFRYNNQRFSLGAAAVSDFIITNGGRKYPISQWKPLSPSDIDIMAPILPRKMVASRAKTIVQKHDIQLEEEAIGFSWLDRCVFESDVELDELQYVERLSVFHCTLAFELKLKLMNIFLQKWG